MKHLISIFSIIVLVSCNSTHKLVVDTSFNLPKPIGPYSYATHHKDLIFVSGQIGVDPLTNALKEGIEEQTIQIFENLNVILNNNGSDFDHITKTTLFLTDMNDFFKGFALRPVFRDFEAEPQIKIEVTEEDKAYKIKAEIPGVKKEDIQVSVDGNRVAISAELKKEKEEKKGEKVIRSERYYGKVSRSFSLDEEVDQGGAQAKYTDGVLDLMLPKKPGAAAKQITVS